MGEPESGDAEHRIGSLAHRVSELESRVVELEQLVGSSRASAPNASRPTPSQPIAATSGVRGGEWPQQPQGWQAVPTSAAPLAAAPMLAAPVPAAPLAAAPTTPVASAPVAAAPTTPVASAPVPAAPWPPRPEPPAATPAGGYPGWGSPPWDQRYARSAQQPTHMWPPAPSARPAPGPSLGGGLGVSIGSLRDLELQLTGRLLAWVGAAAVVLGAAFFLSLAFSRGWIGPQARVGLGLALGEGLVGAGALLFGRRQEQLGHVLVATGLAVVSLALFAGTRLYGLYPPETALAGSFLTALIAAGIAVRYNSQAVAVFGLLAVAAAPPVLGAGATAITIVFLGTAIAGTTAIALVRSWRWLPPIAFAITAPQLVFWLISGADASAAILAIGAYWLLHAIAAAADELRAPAGSEAEARAESLFVANSTLALGSGLYVLWGNLAPWQGAFVASAAAAHFAFGAYFVWRRGARIPFGLLVNGIGVALVAFAIERQFDGPAVAIGWAIEAVVLAAVFGLRRQVSAGGAAVVLASLAVLHLGWYEFPGLHWSLAGGSGNGSFAFADSAGLTLVCLAAASLLGGWLSRSRTVMNAMTIVCLLTVAYALPYELSGPSLVAGWASAAVALVALFGPRRNPYAAAAEALLAGLALVHLGSFEYPGLAWSLAGGSGPGPFPFADSAGLTLACLLVAAVLAGLLSRSREVRNGLTIAASLAIAYSLPYELSSVALVAGWAAEAVVLIGLFGLRKHPYATVSAALFAGAAVLHLGSIEFPWASWSPAGGAGPGSFAFDDPAGLTLACLLLAAVLAGWLSRSHSLRCGLTTAGLLSIAYALPFELSGVALVAGWAVLVPAAVAAEGLLDRLPGAPAARLEQRSVRVLAMNEVHWPDSPLVAAAGGVFLVLSHLLVYDLPIRASGGVVLPSVPFADLATASAAAGVAAFLAAALITARADLRAALIMLATGLAAYSCDFELALPFAVVAWCVLTIAIGSLFFFDRPNRWAYVAGGATLLGVAAAVTLLAVAPADRLGVRAGVAVTGGWFALDSILAIGAVVCTLAIAARLLPLGRSVRTTMVLTGAAGLVYLLSILVVDFFQVRVGGATPLEELQKQAQVCVSILWGLIGMAVFVTGIVNWRQSVREAGLALLAIATVKVFLFDLSYLDVAYRVLSLMGLGLLLLAGAYAYQTLRPHRPEPEQAAAASEATGVE